MGYIIKDTAALLNTRLTDAARKKNVRRYV